MTPEQFVYWLRGISEDVGNPASTSLTPTDAQWQLIKANLKQVVFQTRLTTTTHHYETGTPPHLDPTRITC